MYGQSAIDAVGLNMGVSKFLDLVNTTQTRGSSNTSRNSELWECMRYAGLIGPIPEDPDARSEDDNWEEGEMMPQHKPIEKNDIDEGVETDNCQY